MKETRKIILVQIDGYKKDDWIINAATERMELVDKEIVDRWFGTYAPGRKAVQYTFKASKKFFDCLLILDSFSSIGMDDIAFLDSRVKCCFIQQLMKKKHIFTKSILES